MVSAGNKVTVIMMMLNDRDGLVISMSALYYFRDLIDKYHNKHLVQESDKHSGKVIKIQDIEVCNYPIKIEDMCHIFLNAGLKSFQKVVI